MMPEPGARPRKSGLTLAALLSEEAGSDDQARGPGHVERNPVCVRVLLNEREPARRASYGAAEGRRRASGTCPRAGSSSRELRIDNVTAQRRASSAASAPQAPAPASVHLGQPRAPLSPPRILTSMPSASLPRIPARPQPVQPASSSQAGRRAGSATAPREI